MRALALLLLLAGLAAAKDEETVFRKEWKGRKGPSLPTARDDWLNVARPPTLRGKVVLLQFCFLG